MKIAYGTYGMPDLDPLDAIRTTADIGYDGIEICCGPKWPTSPDKLDAAARAAMQKQLQDAGLEVPALMLLADFLADDPAQHAANLDAFKAAAQLGRDLGLERPVVTFTMGGRSDQYEAQRDEIARRLKDYAAAAESCGAVAAAEPHVGGAIDRPDRAVWLMKAVDSPFARLNFDISHFALIGLGIEECVTPLVPYAAHTHVKDGRMEGGKVRFLLPGEGDFDYPAYLKAMQKAGWTGHITVEISGQIWNAPGYDALEAARKSYAALDEAFRAAGVDRG